jgi:hypothetical protein
MSEARRRNRGPFPWRVHPIWRGIGCLLLIVLPLIAYGFSDLIIAYAQANSPAFAQSLRNNPNLLEQPYLRILFTAVITAILYLVFSVLASLIYSLAGGPLNEEVASMTRGRKNF